MIGNPGHPSHNKDRGHATGNTYILASDRTLSKRRSLHVDISKLKTPTRGPARNRSVYDDWIDTLTTPEQEAVLNAVTDRAWGHVALLEVLADEGAPRTSSSSFQAWRHKMGLPR